MERTFIKIERTNSYGEKTDLVLDLNSIIAIKGLHQETKKFFDEEGNLVKEEEREPLFYVIMENCEPFYIDKTNYDLLVAALIK